MAAGLARLPNHRLLGQHQRPQGGEATEHSQTVARDNDRTQEHRSLFASPSAAGDRYSAASASRSRAAGRIHHFRHQVRHAVSQQGEIDPGGVSQRPEMRIAVAVDVDRLDRNFLDRDAARLNDEELLGLEFIAIGADAEAKFHQPSRNSPEAGLGIAEIEPDQRPIDIARNRVAEPVSQGNGIFEAP